MKVILFSLCLLLSLEASQYTFLTYNVWFNYPTASERVPKLLDIVHEESPDVITFQEVEP